MREDEGGPRGEGTDPYGSSTRGTVVCSTGDQATPMGAHTVGTTGATSADPVCSATWQIGQSW